MHFQHRQHSVAGIPEAIKSINSRLHRRSDLHRELDLLRLYRGMRSSLNVSYVAGPRGNLPPRYRWGVQAIGANSVRPINAPKPRSYRGRVCVTLRNERGTFRICSGSATSDAGASSCLAPGRQLRSLFFILEARASCHDVHLA
jgi:hypothetical protein